MNKTKWIIQLTNRYSPVVIAMIGYISLAIFYTLVLKYDFFRSDVLGYWQDSLEWKTPFHSFHVPGYPLLIALLRGITFGLFSPVTYMIVINLIALSLSVYLIFKIILTCKIKEEIAKFGALLFAFWPLVGLTYTVTPLADVPAICLTLFGIFYLQQSRKISAGFFLGIAMLFHKAIWPIIGLIILIEIVRKNEKFLSIHNLKFLALILLPISILWIFGAFYHQSIFWLFSSNLSTEIASQGNLPILDGVIGTLFSGGIKGVIKGLILLGFMLVTIFALVLSIRVRDNSKKWLIAISSAVLILFIILNQGEIWAAVRFSRLLVLPLVIGYSWHNNCKAYRWTMSTKYVLIFFSFLFLSQFVYAWYEAKIYFA